MIELTIAAIEAHNPKYLGHPSRVAELSCAIGQRLNVNGQDYKDLYYAALLHDVGLLVLGHRVLGQKMTLLSRDRGRESAHPHLGADLLKEIRLFQGLVPLIRNHHEHWDGSGTPEGFSGDQIPMGARILCLLEYLEDVRFTLGEAPDLMDKQIETAKAGSGTKFDPQVVDAYLTLMNAAKRAESH